MFIDLVHVARRAGRSTRHLTTIGLTAALVTMFGWQHAQAAVWQGGSGDWTDPAKWDIGVGTDDYPGSPTQTATFADFDNNGPGTVTIKAGDTINHSSVAFFGVGGADLSQTGGTYIVSNRIRMRTSYSLTGGTLTGSGIVSLNNGATFTIDGGEFGTRLTTHDSLGTPNTSLEFVADGTLVVTQDGIVDVNNINLSTSTGTAVIEARGVVPSDGDAFKRSVVANFSIKGNDSTAKFVFSADGITPWTIIGGSANSLDLGTAINGDQGKLDVDLGPLWDDGTTPYTLFAYSHLTGSFGDINVHRGGSLFTPGVMGNLQLGEYYLDYTGGDGTDIVLYANVPEPATACLACLGGLVVLTRRRARGLAA